VLELGAGTGLASIALAKSGRRVIASDFSQAAIDNLRRNALRNGIGEGLLEAVRWDFEKELPEKLRGQGVTHVIGADIWLPAASQGHGLAHGLRSIWDEYGRDTLEATHLVLVWRPKFGVGSIFDDMQTSLNAVGLESAREQQPWANAGIVEAAESTPPLGTFWGTFWRSWWQWWILPTLQLHTVTPVPSSSLVPSPSLPQLYSFFKNKGAHPRLEPHVPLRSNRTRTTAHDDVIPAGAREKGEKDEGEKDAPCALSLLDRVKAETLAAHAAAAGAAGAAGAAAAAATANNKEPMGATGNTWWFEPSSEEPQCAIEEAIAMLYKNVLLSESASAGETISIVGAEWWVQHRRIDRPLYFHLDTDVGRHTQACIRCPSLSSILFLSDTGGPTCILGQRPTESRWTGKLQLSPAEATEADVVFPKRGRYVLFKGDLLHGVLPPPSLPPKDSSEDAAKNDEKMRTTLLINWWVGDKPLAPHCSHPSPELYARLRDVSGGGGNVGGSLSPKIQPKAVRLATTDLQAGGALGGPGQVQCAKLSFDVDLGSAAEGGAGSVTTSMYLPIELVEKRPAAPAEMVAESGAHRITGMGRVRLVENQLP
jgi:hypothetical protein